MSRQGSPTCNREPPGPAASERLRSDLTRPLTWLLALQWLGLMVPVSVSVMVVNADILGVHGTAIGGYVAHSLVWVAVFTLLQLLFGHRMPSFEGPATVVVAALIFAIARSRLVEPAPVVAGALLCSAAVLVILAGSGLLRWLSRTYSPFANCVFLTLLVLTAVWAVVPRALERGGHWPAWVPPAALVAVVGTSVLLELRGRGLARTLSLLFGLATGAAVFQLGGGLSAPGPDGTGLAHPGLVRPLFSPGVAVPLAAVAVLVAMNSVATGAAVAMASARPFRTRSLVRGLLVTGLSHGLQGLLPGVGSVPHVESAALVTRCPPLARASLLLASGTIGALALVPASSQFLVRIPPALGDDVLLAVLASLAILAVRELARTVWIGWRAAVFAIAVGSCLLLIYSPPRLLPGALSYLALSPILPGMALVLAAEAVNLARGGRASRP